MPEHPTAGLAPDIPGVDHLELIGVGGFSAVYRGWQAHFNRWVAVKVLTGPHGDAPGYRFDHELRALGSLSEHPHVVPVYEAGHAAGLAYLVMPYLTGGSLQDRMAQGPVTPAEVVATGQAVADVLAEAHRLGILHRDIKPANILFTGFGVPQLADFGVAHLSDATLTGGLLAVTVNYAPPEVLSGQPASVRSDVYSLGATLYAALRGHPPFRGANQAEEPVAQALRVVTDEPEPLRSFGIPAQLAAVVERAMAKDPEARYDDAAALRDALASLDPAVVTAPTGRPDPVTVGGPAPALVGAGVAAAAATGGGSAPRKRRAGLLAVAGTLVALAAAGTVGGLSLAGHHDTAGAPRGPAARTHVPAPAPAPTTIGSKGSQPAKTPDSPPSAGSATSPAAVPAAILESAIRSYYSLVDTHRLDQSWQWLSPAFQARIGPAYYRQFWESISQVQVVSVTAAHGVATVTLSYLTTAGASSIETARLGFVIGSGNVLLIDTDRASAG